MRFQKSAARYTCTAQQFLQANTRVPVKAFLRNKVGSQTAADTHRLCLCERGMVNISEHVHERHGVTVTLCEHYFKELTTFSFFFTGNQLDSWQGQPVQVGT